MKKVVLAAIIIVIIGAFFVLNNINPIVKKGVESAGSKVLSAPVTLQKSDISIFSGSGSLAGLTIGNPSGFTTDYAFQLKEIQVSLDVKSVTTDTIHIKNILIDSPSIIFEGNFGKSNLSQLMANAKAFSGGAKKTETTAQETQDGPQQKKMVIDHVKLTNGSISVSMSMLQDQKLTVPLPAVELTGIGKNGETTAAEAMEQVLAAVTQAVIPAVQSGVANINLDEKAQEAGKAMQENVGKKLDSFKGILGK